jgi:hypothetical protein
MNPFQNNYESRLREWRQLRDTTRVLTLERQCIEIDRWWQQAPLVNRYLHWNDESNWSDPWTILSENTYCVLTRAIGMCYTLLMNDVKQIELVLAQDEQAEEHYLVLVNNAKYTLNYWPDSVISTSLQKFKIINSKSLESLKNKIK